MIDSIHLSHIYYPKKFIRAFFDNRSFSFMKKTGHFINKNVRKSEADSFEQINREAFYPWELHLIMWETLHSLEKGAFILTRCFAGY